MVWFRSTVIVIGYWKVTIILIQIFWNAKKSLWACREICTFFSSPKIHSLCVIENGHSLSGGGLKRMRGREIGLNKRSRRLLILTHYILFKASSLQSSRFIHFFYSGGYVCEGYAPIQFNFSWTFRLNLSSIPDSCRLSWPRPRRSGTERSILESRSSSRAHLSLRVSIPLSGILIIYH